MTEITMFALALLSVPVLARFGRVPAETRKIYHLIGLSGLFMLLGEATHWFVKKFAFMSAFAMPVDMLTAFIAYLSILAGTVWIAVYYMKHVTES